MRILNGRALARMITMRWMNIFRCTTVNLQSVHTLYTKFNVSVYTLCTVYTHCVYRKFDEFSTVSTAKPSRRFDNGETLAARWFRHPATSFKARKQHILEYPSIKVIRQTVVSQPPAYISYVKLTNHPNHPNHPGKNGIFSHAPASKNRPRFGKIRLDVQLLVYTVQCTHSVYTHSVHTPTILQFGAFLGGYHTAAPLECTTHGDIVYPELEYMYLILDPDVFT